METKQKKQGLHGTNLSLLALRSGGGAGPLDPPLATPKPVTVSSDARKTNLYLDSKCAHKCVLGRGGLVAMLDIYQCKLLFYFTA